MSVKPAKPKNALEALKAARAILAKPGVWIQGRYVLKDGGKMKFCAVGALQHVYGIPRLGQFSPRLPPAAYDFLKKAIPKKGDDYDEGDYVDVEEYNDMKGTTRAEVLALYTRAIALATAYAKKKRKA